MVLNTEISSRIVSVGKDNIPILVIDGAVPNAITFKQHAINSCKDLFEQGLYPGFRCKTMPQYNRLLVEIVNDQIEQHVNQFGGSFAKMTNADAYFSMVTKKPEELVEAQRIPHYDRPESGQLAAVHYLCDDTHGGTSFYRHKSSANEIIDTTKESNYLVTLAGETKLHPPEYQYMNGDTPLFERIHQVEAKFNRIVVYPSNCLHSGDIPKDFVPTMNPLEGRFTVTAFLE